MKIILIERFPCTHKYELKSRERYWIETLKADLNKNIPTRTKQEYQEDNKEQITQQRKEYYEANIEQIAEKVKEYREDHKEQIAEYAKEYYDTNFERIAKRNAIAYKETKDEFEDYEKIYRQMDISYLPHNNVCECGGKYTRQNTLKHYKTKKHQQWFKVNPAVVWPPAPIVIAEAY